MSSTNSVLLGVLKVLIHCTSTSTFAESDYRRTQPVCVCVCVGQQTLDCDRTLNQFWSPWFEKAKAIQHSVDFPTLVQHRLYQSYKQM